MREKKGNAAVGPQEAGKIGLSRGSLVFARGWRGRGASTEKGSWCCFPSNGEDRQEKVVENHMADHKTMVNLGYRATAAETALSVVDYASVVRDCLSSSLPEELKG